MTRIQYIGWERRGHGRWWRLVQHHYNATCWNLMLYNTQILARNGTDGFVSSCRCFDKDSVQERRERETVYKITALYIHCLLLFPITHYITSQDSLTLSLLQHHVRSERHSLRTKGRKTFWWQRWMMMAVLKEERKRKYISGYLVDVQ